MLVIGLTGGIGSGKSTAASLFAELGVPIVDTDLIAHELTQPGQPALDVIRRRFGKEFIRPTGELDRVMLRRLVFSDPAERRALEAILHPLIKAEVMDRIQTLNTPYVIVAIPLLFEKGAYRNLVNRALVIDSSEEQQIERVVARSKLCADDVRAIMASQIANGERLRLADDICANRGDLEELRKQVEALHEKYLQLAQ